MLFECGQVEQEVIGYRAGLSARWVRIQTGACEPSCRCCGWTPQSRSPSRQLRKDWPPVCKRLVASHQTTPTLSSTSADMTSASQYFLSHSIGHFSFKLASNRLRIFGFWWTRSPCSLRMYMRARPSRGPQKGRSVPGLAGRERRLQLTLFSAIICITVFRQPALVYETFFTSPKASLRHSTRLLAPWLSCTWGLAVMVAVWPGQSNKSLAGSRDHPASSWCNVSHVMRCLEDGESPDAGLRQGLLWTSQCPTEPHGGQGPKSSPELCWWSPKKGILIEDYEINLLHSHSFELTVSRAWISGPKGNAVLSSLAAIVPSMHIPEERVKFSWKEYLLSFRLIAELLEEHAAAVLASEDLTWRKLTRTDHLKDHQMGQRAIKEISSFTWQESMMSYIKSPLSRLELLSEEGVEDQLGSSEPPTPLSLSLKIEIFEIVLLCIVWSARWASPCSRGCRGLGGRGRESRGGKRQAELTHRLLQPSLYKILKWSIYFEKVRYTLELLIYKAFRWC